MKISGPLPVWRATLYALLFSVANSALIVSDPDKFVWKAVLLGAIAGVGAFFTGLIAGSWWGKAHWQVAATEEVNAYKEKMNAEVQQIKRDQAAYNRGVNQQATKLKSLIEEGDEWKRKFPKPHPENDAPPEGEDNGALV